MLTGGRAQYTNYEGFNKDPRDPRNIPQQNYHSANRQISRDNGFKASAHRILDVPGVVPHAMNANT
jgi:hypothetical protein